MVTQPYGLDPTPGNCLPVVGQPQRRPVRPAPIAYPAPLPPERQLPARPAADDNRVRHVLIAGSALLLLGVAVVYNRYRLRQRTRRQLQAQQEALQAQQEELRAQHEALQSQREALRAQQREIGRQHEQLSQLLDEKDSLLRQKDCLAGEKERLLKEIHHRVRNNLQVVMSLLNSQAASLQDQAALSAIQESQHRVQAMALIHQKLYQAKGLTRIPMPAYLEEVLAYLTDAYRLTQAVRFYAEADDIELDVAQAVPLGLIINEAVTNTLRYAFPGGRPGRVLVALQRLEECAYRLTVADDGVGLPAGYDPSRSRSLGMTLLHGFSAQLGGELRITGPPGLTLTLVFQEEPLPPTHTSPTHVR
ncbi:MAG TPA: histidine kinase dimerization/phosphoacceptor domain -containing protein [Cytophagales bacterium]